ncbi:MAG: aspartate aminotransferase family protein [Zoogloea sp.]|uniref:aspartate aminotransferase family protein n=1 Tax=Zoogloea sp. TaxID=49181 RepID=UPI003F3AB8D9
MSSPLITPQGIAALYQREAAHFTAAHPRSAALAEETGAHFLWGVPMHWMNDWSFPSPLFVQSAEGARFTCADGLEYDDFCLGDTGAMFGHSPAPVAAAIARQAARGLTTMLPSEDAAPAGRLLAERFGLPFWQLATTASDANRFVLRWARAITGRKHIVVFDGCYHGTVDDVFVDLTGPDKIPRTRDSLLGQVYDLSEYTRVVEFNDLAGLEAALADGQVACVITEPALTNIGMVLPDPGFLDGVRALTRHYGSLLVIDETHTISTGPGGASQAWDLDPDFLVIGKPVAGGLPCAVYGMTASVAAKMRAAKDQAPPGHSGIGTTLTGNPLSLAALRANLESVMNEAAYAHMLPLARQLADGLRRIIADAGLPWSVTDIGARAEFQFRATPPRTGREAEAGFNPPLERLIHLYLINRGVMITPFHNMTLVCPATTAEAVNRLHTHFAACVGELLAS